MDSNSFQGKIKAVIIGVVITVVVFFSSFQLVENVDAGEIIVIQSVRTGNLTWYTTPGPKFQGFGSVTRYKKRSIYNFDAKIRFNEGGHATLQGSMQWEMPLANEQLTEIHSKFGSNDAVAKQLIEVVSDKSIFMTGPLLSSTESYAEKRPNLIYWVEDQITNGVYQNTLKVTKQKDPITGEEKTVTVADIATDSGGKALRQEPGQLSVYGIHSSNFAITDIKYDDKVEAQIGLQQDNIMAVQTAIAQSRKAEQDALTTEQQGKAIAAKAKWEQEAVKAKAVTEAQQNFEVAKLDADQAEQEKRANILRGEGEARRKQLVMTADGALEQKLAAWVSAQQAWAEAASKYQGAWVPSVVMGGMGGQSINGATGLMDLMMSKYARDLSLDLSPSRQVAGMTSK